MKIPTKPNYNWFQAFGSILYAILPITILRIRLSYQLSSWVVLLPKTER